MRKLFFAAVSTFVIFAAIAANDSLSRDRYGDAVDSFCKDSNPFAGDCLLCHASNSKSTWTPEMYAYSAGELCSFCPNDSSCTRSACTDTDHDGFFAESGCGTPVDCNDNDPLINPNATEICYDSKDNDCNGAIDIQDRVCGIIICTDVDGDGYSLEGGDCGPMDCNDDNPDIYPGAEDFCSDGIDQDCSGKDRTKGKGCKVTSKATRIGREGKGKTCSDGLDNDLNGRTDCEDPGCSTNRACRN